jgi:hypothetical protein
MGALYLALNVVWLSMRNDIDNAAQYAKISKHLSNSQNATDGIHISSCNSIFIRSEGIVYTFGTSIVGTAVVVLVAGALKPAWSECFL